MANEYYVGAINRVGIEPLGDDDFYGQSYFVDPEGSYDGKDLPNMYMKLLFIVSLLLCLSGAQVPCLQFSSCSTVDIYPSGDMSQGVNTRERLGRGA